MTTEIVEYSATEAALIELQGRLQGVTYEITTPAGLDLAKTDRRELIRLRTSLEKLRAEFKAPILARGKALDDEAKRITAELVKLEKPIDDQIKAEETRREAIRKAKAEAEAKRVADIRAIIAEIAMRPAKAAGLGSEAIGKFITLTEAVVLTADNFDEFLQEAIDTWAATIQTLADMKQSAIAQEEEAARIAAEREELKRLKEQQEAEQREALAKLERQRAEQDAAAKAEAKRQAEELAAERAAIEELRKAQQEEADRIRAEQDHRQAMIDAETKAVADRAAAEAKAAADAQAAAESVQKAKDDVLASQSALAEAKFAAVKPVVIGVDTKPRPTDDRIIDVLCDHFRAHESEVIGWLLTMDLAAASQNLATEFA